MERKFFLSKLTVLCYVLLLLFTACSNTDDIDPNDDAGQAGLPAFSRIDGGRLVAIAACRLFDNKESSWNLRSSASNAVINAAPVKNLPQTRASEAGAESFRTKYGFDHIQIFGGIRYTVKNAGIPLISEICGDGEIDVILTNFVAYIVSERGEFEIGEGLIVFRSEQGIYACMINSAGEYTEYSSHKRFEQNAVVKDFTPPVYVFYLKGKNGAQMLSGALIVSEDGSYQKTPTLKWFPLKEQESTSESRMFDISELLPASQIEQQCTITEKGEKYFLTTGGANLKQVYFDEYTEFSINGNPATHTDIAAGDQITVAFDKLYEKYNPQRVFANRVTKNPL